MLAKLDQLITTHQQDRQQLADQIQALSQRLDQQPPPTPAPPTPAPSIPLLNLMRLADSLPQLNELCETLAERTTQLQQQSATTQAATTTLEQQLNELDTQVQALTSSVAGLSESVIALTRSEAATSTLITNLAAQLGQLSDSQPHRPQPR